MKTYIHKKKYPFRWLYVLKFQVPTSIKPELRIDLNGNATMVAVESAKGSGTAKPFGVKKGDIIRFTLAGISSMGGATVTNPIDVIKIRLQLDNELSDQKNIFKHRKYKGVLHGFRLIVREEGLRGLFKGLSPSLMREGSYSAIRLGLYEPFKEIFGEKNKAHTPLYKKILCAGLSGSIGSAIANPTDLVKIRMQGQGKLNPGDIPRYRSTMHAFKSIVVEEGVLGLWRGVGPTVQRAAIVSAAQISSYDHTKHLLMNYCQIREGLYLHVISAMVAGLVTAIFMSPVDLVKTRVMNQYVENRSGSRYSSAIDCFAKTITSEGLLGFYKGFIPNWLRLGPHTITTFLIFEQLRKLCGIDPI